MIPAEKLREAVLQAFAVLINLIAEQSAESGVAWFTAKTWPCIWCGVSLDECDPGRDGGPCCDLNDHPYPSIGAALSAHHLLAEPVRLLAADVCVSCFDAGHPEGPCECGCPATVTEEARGRIEVPAVGGAALDDAERWRLNMHTLGDMLHHAWNVHGYRCDCQSVSRTTLDVDFAEQTP